MRLSARVFTREFIPITFDFRFFDGFCGVVFFCEDFASFGDAPDEAGGFTPQKERMSVIGRLPPR